MEELVYRRIVNWRGEQTKGRTDEGINTQKDRQMEGQIDT